LLISGSQNWWGCCSSICWYAGILFFFDAYLL